METAIIGAVAAILGSLVGGLSSLITSWVTQNQRLQAERYDKTVSAREALYGEFIQQATRLLAHAAEHEDGPVSELVPLFAVIARMRLFASQDIIDEAERFVQVAIGYYGEPNLTLAQLSKLATEHRPDPLKPFSEACRRELESLRR